MSCTVYYDWSSLEIPGYQGNCYAVTNAQVNYMQIQGYLTSWDGIYAPNDNYCITKDQLEYVTGGNGYGIPINGGAAYASLVYNNLVPIGYFGVNNYT